MKKNMRTRFLAMVLVLVMVLGVAANALAEITEAHYNRVVNEIAHEHWENLMDVRVDSDFETVTEGLTDENKDAIITHWTSEELTAVSSQLRSLHAGWGVYTDEERATFTQGYELDGEKPMGIELQNVIQTLGEHEFNFAVNQMNEEQYDSFFEEAIDNRLRERAFRAIVHNGFPVKKFTVTMAKSMSYRTTRATAPVWPAEGSINLTKTANAIEGTDNQWEITLTIEGKNYKTTSDVVLVMDISSSMNTNDRIGKAKLAAEEFVDQLLVEGGSTRVSLITYDGTVDEPTKFYTYNNKNELIAKIRGLSTGSGTFTQGGLHEADALLHSAESTGVLKNIVLLSDGEPYKSYNYSGTATATCNGNAYRHRFYTPYTNISGSFDYDNAGGATSLEVTCSCPRTDTVNSGLSHTEKTIMEANLIKANNTTIYSIALQAGSSGEACMEGCASDASKGYFEIGDNDNIETTLNSAFKSIAGSIAIAASNGTVSDIMGEKVQLQYKAGTEPTYTNDLAAFRAGTYDIYVSQGSITGFNAETADLDWNVGNINEGTPAVMKYRIGVKDGITPSTGEVLDANTEAKFTYIDYQQNNAEALFPIPQVTIGGGMLLVHWYRVDKDGNPVNANGEIVEEKKFAQQLATAAYHEVNGKTSLSYNTEYTVTPDTFDEYVYFKYNLNDGALTSGNEVKVTLTTANSNQDVWFAYYKVENGALTIEKEVEDPSFNGGTFNFTITPPDGVELPSTVTSPVAITIPAGSTKASVKLEDLPAGEYTVTEQNAEDYDTTVTVNGGTPTNAKTAAVEVPAGGEAALIFTNDRKEGDLVISKTVTGENIPADTEFTFTVVLNNAGSNYSYAYEGANGAANGTITESANTITLKNGESVTIKDLPYGATYTVTETVPDLYTNEMATVTGEVDTAEERAEFTNVYTAGYLTITKNVVNNPGYNAPLDTFKFTLNLTDAGGNALTGTYKVKDSDATITNGAYEFQLGHGESVTILGLPAGAKYKVEEDSVENYGFVTTYSNEKGEGTIATGSNAVTVTNTYTPGSLKITKNVEDGAYIAPETFTFTVELPANVNLPIIEGVTQSGNTATIEMEVPVSTKTANVVLTNLLPGNYTVVETANSKYTTSSNPTDGKVSLQLGENKQIDFTNTRNYGDLVISKVVNETNAPATDVFTFTVDITGAGETYSYNVLDAEGNAITGVGPITETNNTITLKKGESVTIKNLPYGVTYTVTEPKANWPTGYNVGQTEDKVETGTIASESVTETFTNVYTTHDIAVKKTVEGLDAPATDTFPIKLTLTDTTLDKVSYTITKADDTPGSNGEIALMAGTAENEKYVSVTVTKDETVTFTGIPSGTQYKVEEILSGDKYTVTLKQGTDTLGKIDTTLNANASYEVVNTYTTGSLTVKKKVNGTLEAGQRFVLDVYKVGENDNDVWVTQLVLGGEDSNNTLTLTGLEYGTYYVVEDLNWAGRYTLEGYDPVRAEVTKDNNPTIEVTNTRKTSNQWLDANAGVTNNFATNGEGNAY